ncbi:MAG: hypothetical protein ACTHKU_07885 [Verrucomicrobiota bacterium]
MTIDRGYDAQFRLAGGSVVNGINYQFDTLDRRREAALADGTNGTTATTMGAK